MSEPIRRTGQLPAGEPPAGEPARESPAGGPPAGQLLAGQAAARSLLTGERASAEARLAALQRDFDGIVSSSASAATDDEHDPEGGTTAFERQHIAALISQAQDRLAEIGNALIRLNDGSYGDCERCGDVIAAERLAARPTARHCIDCAAV
jgi:DnaK suppressor protein